MVHTAWHRPWRAGCWLAPWLDQRTTRGPEHPVTTCLKRFLCPAFAALALLTAFVLPAPAPIDAQSVSLDAAMRVAQLTNDRRAAAGLAPLQVNQQAMITAQWFAEDQARNDYVSNDHLDSLRRNPIQRANESGYTGWFTLGENIAGMIPTPEQVVGVWMNSDAHRAAILNPEFCEVGVGYAENPDGFYRFHWVQLFGCRRSEPQPAPAATAQPATDAATDPAAEALPGDATAEPAAEALPVDATVDPAAFAVPVDAVEE